MDMLLLCMDGLLVAYCLNFLMEVNAWATVGAVNRLMRTIVMRHPSVWTDAQIDLSKKKVKKKHCVLIQSLLKNAKLTIISVKQLALFQNCPGNYQMHWTAKMPYCNPQSGKVYPVIIRGFHGYQRMFISQLPMVRGMCYTVLIHCYGSRPFFDMGISECSAASNIRRSFLGYARWEHLTTVAVQAHSHLCVPFHWVKNGICMKRTEDAHPNMLPDFDANISAHSTQLGMQWNADSVTFKFREYHDTLMIPLPTDTRFYFFIDICASSDAIVQIHPLKTPFKVLQE